MWRNKALQKTKVFQVTTRKRIQRIYLFFTAFKTFPQPKIIAKDI